MDQWKRHFTVSRIHSTKINTMCVFSIVRMRTSNVYSKKIVLNLNLSYFHVLGRCLWYMCSCVRCDVRLMRHMNWMKSSTDNMHCSTNYKYSPKEKMKGKKIADIYKFICLFIFNSHFSSNAFRISIHSHRIALPVLLINHRPQLEQTFDNQSINCMKNHLFYSHTVYARSLRRTIFIRVINWKNRINKFRQTVFIRCHEKKNKLDANVADVRLISYPNSKPTVFIFLRARNYGNLYASNCDRY